MTTQQAQSQVDPNANILNSVEFKKAGVILEVTPRVNLGGRITLELRQEVSEPVPGSNLNNVSNNPTFTERSIESTVTVQSGETLVLGGLISESKTQSNSGLPFLKDYPCARGSVQRDHGERRARGATGPADPEGGP
ncbi:hypothetical protein BH20PSE1_BH20PSE1_22930 [soil metagenome]